MGKRPLMEFILLLINLVFTLSGLGMLGYGLYCFVKWIPQPPNTISMDNLNIVRRLLRASHDSASHSFAYSLPQAWVFLIGMGATLFIIFYFGYFGTSSRSYCCLLYYFMFLVALTLIELGGAAFIFLKHNRKEVIAISLALYLR